MHSLCILLNSKLGTHVLPFIRSAKKRLPVYILLSVSLKFRTLFKKTIIHIKSMYRTGESITSSLTSVFPVVNQYNNIRK